MRIPAVLRVAAGVGVVLILGTCLVAVEGRKEIKQEKKNELAKPQANVIQSPSILSFFKRLLPDKAINTIRAAVAKTPLPKAKSAVVDDAKTRSMKNKKTTSMKESKAKVAPTTSRTKKTTTTTSKPFPTTRFRTRTSVKPKLTTTNKMVPKLTKKTIATKPPSPVRKQKTGKELRSRHNSKTSFASFKDDKPPSPDEMVVLTPDQQRSRLRQELVRETEDNCLAKILCGPSTKPKPKQQNTMISDTAYLIKEFFNIFDFSIDEVREEVKDEIEEIDAVNKKAYEAEEAEKKKQEQKQKEAEEEEEEEEDDLDDEDDDIYRNSPVSEVPKKKKYTTRIPTSKETVTKTSPPEQKQKQQVVEPPKLEQVMAQPKTKRPKPVSILEMTTVGDMLLINKPTSTVSSSMDRRGEAVTQSSNLFTSTIVSTSMIGSATLKPVDMPFAIPLKTAKDDGDDDEEDDNKRYNSDDNEDEDSTFHRVTLEELVGDIQLSPADLAMIRRGRSMRTRQPRMKVALKDITKDRYIQAKLRELKMATNETKKMKIAQKVARSMREPRQCRQFTQVAQEVLQTCPLTTEVIRFFNTNLKNGTSIEVKRTQPSSQTQGGGLVVLNNDASTTSQQAYFVDNSPQVNTKIQTDLKNPSIPTSYNQDEDQYTVYEKRPNPNPQNSNLNQYGQDITKKTTTTTTEAPTKEPSKEESEEEQDDEGDSDEEEEEDEEDDVAGRKEGEDEEEDEEELEDDTASREDDDADDEESGEDEYNGSDDDSSKNKQKNNDKKVVLKIKENTDHTKIQGILTNQPNVQIAVRPKPRKKPTVPTPTLPPGVIRVYGVPQESFDREFTQLSPIGKPVNLFGDEFLDSPPYKRRRQLGKYGYRTSKKAKTDDDEEIEAAENVAYNARIPKHPPLEPYSNDGDDDDEDVDNTKAYQNPPKKYQSNNGGKPLGGIKGAEGDDDDDDDKRDRSAEKTDDDDDKDNSAEQPPVKISSLDEPPFVPSVMYSVDVHQQGNDYYGGGNSGIGSSPHYGTQNVQYHNQYPQHPNVPVRRPHAYRPLVRPIKIVPDVNVPLTGVNFRPSRDYMRPGRLYPVYH